MDGRKALGFMGWCNYRVRELDELSRLSYMLSTFAEYSSVGGNRT